MKGQAPTFEYLMLFRDAELARRLSPEEMQTLTLEWCAWLERLRRQGKITDGRPLENAGTLISRNSGGLIGNIPLIGSKETITAYTLLQVGHLGEGMEIAKECPVIKHGSTVEVRLVAGKE